MISNNLSNPIRILHVVSGMSTGGLETMIMNWYRNIDRNVIQFDFLVHHSERCFYDDEIEDYGGRIYRLTFSNDHNIIKYLRDLNSFFAKHSKDYKVIHGHHSSYGIFYLKYAKKYGIPTRISHSHIASFSKNKTGFVLFLLSRGYKKYANIHFACSHAAGKYMYGNNNYQVINNGIDTYRFRFSLDARQQIREHMHLENKSVCIHVGRFHDQKNHSFLIDVFGEYQKINPDSVLLLIGGGPLQSMIKAKVNKMGMSESVHFLNKIDNVYDYLSAADIFIFPSLYEGLPLTLVEAQASGLPIICSSNVTHETKLTENYYELSLNETSQTWALKIVDIIKESTSRDASNQIVKEACFDCKDIVEMMSKKYLQYHQESDL